MAKWIRLTDQGWGIENVEPQKRKEIKGIQTGKKGVKISLFTEVLILHRENPESKKDHNE